MCVRRGDLATLAAAITASHRYFCCRQKSEKVVKFLYCLVGEILKLLLFLSFVFLKNAMKVLEPLAAVVFV